MVFGDHILLSFQVGTEGNCKRLSLTNCGNEPGDMFAKSYYHNHLMTNNVLFHFCPVLLIGHVTQIWCPNSVGLKMKYNTLIFFKFLYASQKHHPHSGRTNGSIWPKKGPSLQRLQRTS